MARVVRQPSSCGLPESLLVHRVAFLSGLAEVFRSDTPTREARVCTKCDTLDEMSGGGAVVWHRGHSD